MAANAEHSAASSPDPIAGADSTAGPGRWSDAARLAELARDPRPAVSRAALAAQHPAWGAATLSLLAIGLVVCYLSLRPLALSINQCPSAPELPVCQPTTHAVVVALPVTTLLVGLAVSLLAGRQLAQRGRRPLLAASAGWVVFVLGVFAAYLLAGRV